MVELGWLKKQIYKLQADGYVPMIMILKLVNYYSKICNLLKSDLTSAYTGVIWSSLIFIILLTVSEMGLGE